MLLVFVASAVLFATALLPDAKERVWMNVTIVIGNGTVKEDPKAVVLPRRFWIDANGQFGHDGKLFGQIDPGETVADSLKTRDFLLLRIELINPDETPALIILKVIDQISKGVKDGKRVELTFAYRACVKKE